MLAWNDKGGCGRDNKGVSRWNDKVVADEMIMCWRRGDMVLAGNRIMSFGKISNKVGD